MLYLVQENTFQRSEYDQIFEVLQALNLPYHIVTIAEGKVHLDIDVAHETIFVYGSVWLAKWAAEKGWYPGSFYGNNHQYEKYAAGYGSHLLNYNSKVCRLDESIDWTAKSVWFTKPAKEAKLFTGRLFQQEEWEDFLHDQWHQKGNQRLHAASLLQVAEPQYMERELRLWIVDKKVVSGCYYKYHGDQPYREEIEEEALAFAHTMATQFEVAKAYVMDLALCVDGWKIVEVNCINSAGFYTAPVQPIIEALEACFTSES